MVYHVATLSHDRNILAYVCVCVFMRERERCGNLWRANPRVIT